MALQTTLDKLEQKLQQFGAAATAVGLEDHREMLAANRRRTREGHVAMAKAAGESLPMEDEEMGDILMTGDIQVTKDQPSSTAKIGKDLAKLLAAGAIGAGAVVGGQSVVDGPVPVPAPVVEAVEQVVLDDHTATIRPME
jgi:hypothetical protein